MAKKQEVYAQLKPRVTIQQYKDRSKIESEITAPIKSAPHYNAALVDWEAVAAQVQRRMVETLELDTNIRYKVIDREVIGDKTNQKGFIFLSVRGKRARYGEEYFDFTDENNDSLPYDQAVERIEALKPKRSR